MHEDLIYRLKERARIRRQIPTRKSVQEGQPDRIADLLEEAALALSKNKLSEDADLEISPGDKVYGKDEIAEMMSDLDSIRDEG